MSSALTAPLAYITAPELASRLRENPKDDSLAIIDVRDGDHIGGHIKNSLHIPSSTLSHSTPELVRKLKDKKTVIFHCALSQQRGPDAARRYRIQRERVLGDTNWMKPKEGEEGEQVEDGEEKVERQEVLVLEEGFVGWARRYGEDKALTEAYIKDLWESW